MLEANDAASVPAVALGAWPTTAGMQEVEQCRSNCRERRTVGGRGLPRATGTPVGVERSVSVAFPVRTVLFLTAGLGLVLSNTALGSARHTVSSAVGIPV